MVIRVTPHCSFLQNIIKKMNYREHFQWYESYKEAMKNTAIQGNLGMEEFNNTDIQLAFWTGAWA